LEDTGPRRNPANATWRETRRRQTQAAPPALTAPASQRQNLPGPGLFQLVVGCWFFTELSVQESIKTHLQLASLPASPTWPQCRILVHVAVDSVKLCTVLLRYKAVLVQTSKWPVSFASHSLDPSRFQQAQPSQPPTAFQRLRSLAPAKNRLCQRLLPFAAAVATTLYYVSLSRTRSVARQRGRVAGIMESWNRELLD
jgi:hypothetical protein